MPERLKRLISMTCHPEGNVSECVSDCVKE